MSRAGYTNDGEDQWALIKWRGQVASAIRGKRGQAFLKELRDTLDAMPQKELIGGALEHNGQVCAIGSVMIARGLETKDIEVDDYDLIAEKVGIAAPLVREIEYMNDEYGDYLCRADGVHEGMTSEERRWRSIRAWVVSQIKEQVDADV